MTKIAGSPEYSAEITSEELELLREEERLFQEVLEALDRQQGYDGHRLRIEQTRAQSLTAGIVEAQRAEDKQQLASDEAVSHQLRSLKQQNLEDIMRVRKRPYFARVVLEEREANGNIREIDYKIGTTSNPDCRIIDWRQAALAKLYYDYSEGEEYLEVIQGREREGKILLRNRVDIEESKLLGVTCRYGSFVLEAGEWKRGIRRREGGCRGLPDVLSLVTKEQFQTITKEANSAVLIQGVAGSGKTTVALYRLSWLVQESKGSLESSACAVAVRSGALGSYIKNSLPTLQLEGTKVFIFQVFLEKAIHSLLGEGVKIKSFTNPGFLRLKHSLAFKKALKDYVEGQYCRVLSHLQSKFGDDLQGFLIDRQKPLLVFLSEFEAYLRKIQKLDEEQTQVLSGLRRRLTLYEGDLSEILHRPEGILQYDKSGLLDKELIESACETLLENKEKGECDRSDVSVLIFLALLKNGRVAGLQGYFKHLVIDEVQDFTPLELELLLSLVEKREQLTIAGDTAQELRVEGSFPGWEVLCEHWKFEDGQHHFVELKISHRSTLPIMRIADFVLGERRTKQGRKGSRPLWYKCQTDEEAIREAIGWLERVIQRHPDDLTAVICATKSEAHHVASLLEPTFGLIVRVGEEEEFSFDEGIVVTTAEGVKGLEFPHVLIWNPSRKAFPKTEEARKMLYVACTRAQDHLCFVSWSSPSKLLPHIHSRLLRGIEIGLEDEE